MDGDSGVRVHESCVRIRNGCVRVHMRAVSAVNEVVGLTKGRYTLPVFTAREHGQCVPAPVNTGREHG